MSYSCSDFTDSIIDALGVDIPDESQDSPSDQADICLEEIGALIGFRQDVFEALVAVLENNGNPAAFVACVAQLAGFDGDGTQLTPRVQEAASYLMEIAEIMGDEDSSILHAGFTSFRERMWQTDEDRLSRRLSRNDYRLALQSAWEKVHIGNASVSSMTPDFTGVLAKIVYAPGASRRDLLERLAIKVPALEPYRGALVDIINDNQDDAIEIYNIPDMDGDFVSSTNGVRLLFMPEINRAALNSYQSGDWQWTDACSPEEALELYRTGTMRP